MEFEVKRVSNGPKHHLFGFHDLVQTNGREDFALSLEVDDISRPPLPDETCGNGVVDLITGEFHKISRTHTWNYPMGARQQWIGKSDFFTCNDRDSNGHLCSLLCDARRGIVVDHLPFPVHSLNSEKSLAFFFDYDRIYGVGGYGYVNSAKNLRLEDLPKGTGIGIGNIKNGKSDLLVSIHDVASCGERHPVKTGFPHYVTHAMLNPSGTRLLFLHRYRVPDGGEITRLMTIGIDGSGLRCLAKGRESHFTWIDEDEIFIWGEDGRKKAAIRENPLWRIPGLLKMLKFVKTVRRWTKGHSVSIGGSSVALDSGCAFLKIGDAENSAIVKTGVGVVGENGHPMANPHNLRWLVNDTYPDRAGDRVLMFYDVDSQARFDVGKFRMLPDKPDMTQFDWESTRSGVDLRIVRDFPIDSFLFFRSGLHCDLHPRWSNDGNIVYFDSIHEGTRQMYSCKVLK